VNEELLMRALTGRAIDAELAAVEAWRAALPEHERQLRELEHLLADIAAWYRATPLRPAPAVDALILRAERTE
jgi:ferric-dicitrate binding protein FerR (iron transport regulator)